MYLRYLHYLRLVIDHGSFAAAARAAGVTQPAISHAMAQLQRQFNTPLFERTGRRQRPTVTALKAGLQGLHLTEQIGASAGAHKVTSRNKALRIGATPSAALVCGPALYAACRELAPNRPLELCSADEGRMLAQLQGAELDLVISPQPRGHQGVGLHSQSLYQITPRVYARRAHPLAKARSLEQLQSAHWGIVGPSVSGPVDVLQEAHAVRRMPAPKVSVSCPDYASLLHLMCHTDLLAVLPHPALLQANADEQIVALKLREALPRYDMRLFTAARPGSTLKRVVAELQQQLGPA
ncbi:LysR family transcriptional regulator [Curvibacter gracilis]|uniref:LysR family transcriptional regulator n=1 Tax=Curvibacter gracilis TaxID=230310 RepID=UPI000483D903|nr:LysR family transcriptional regulator [Curvibacter gracilis]